ncbi:LysM peptidoglycan-binding domain-containing protein, partial [Kineococcus sp. R8]|uniref:LysM peptidoglycan-binding domain-containing protein n=1 Tax=Kineococcus siccus TaxID=2696567 RepID=UPI00141288F0
AAAVPAGAPAAARAAAVPAAAPAAEVVVTVERGDTVGALAARHGSTVAAVVAANGLGRGARIVEGRTLRIPATTAGPDTASTDTASPDTASPDAAARYTVRTGDTLTSIAASQGTSVAALRAANGLDARGFIRDGQVLALGPGAAAAPAETPAAPAGETYTVRAGDTLSGIAAARGTTVAQLRAANDLGADGFLREGQRLVLAGGAAPAAAPPVQAGSVAEAAAANRERLAGADLPSRARMQEIIRSTAVRLGVDPSLALAVAYQESGFAMRVVSSANAIGAMQVIPSSGEWAEDLLDEDIDLFDPEDNAKAGVAILRTLVANNPPDVAIASYYQGNASVRARGMYDDTRRYVANVQTLQARFR